MSPLQIQQQINYYSRLLRDIAMRYTIAYLSDSHAEAAELRDEAHRLRVEVLRLKAAYERTVTAQSERLALEQAQREAVAEVEMILALHWQANDGRSGNA